MANIQAEIENCVLVHEGFTFHVRSLPGLDDDLPPVICIGGAFQSIGSWKATADYFQPQRRVLLVDLPGMGESDWLPHSYGLDYLAGCIESCLDWAGCETVDILAASYGSLVTYRFAQLYPHRVQHMALVGVMADFEEEHRRLVLEHLDRVERDEADFAEEVLEFLVSQTVRRRVRRGRAVVRVLRKQLEQLSAEEINKYVDNTRRLLNHEPLDLMNPPRVPALVFTGEHDHLTKPAWNREIAAAIPGSIFTTVRDADHLCHLEQFDTAIDLVSCFFDDHSLADVRGRTDLERF